MWTRRRCTGSLASKTFPTVSSKFPQWSVTSRGRRGFFAHRRCRYCRCSAGRAACWADPPARSSAGTYSAGAAAVGRYRSAAAMGFPCQCCCLKQQSGTTDHPTKGVVVPTGWQSRCMNRPISAPVECEDTLRLGDGTKTTGSTSWKKKRLQPWASFHQDQQKVKSVAVVDYATSLHLLHLHKWPSFGENNFLQPKSKKKKT